MKIKIRVIISMVILMTNYFGIYGQEPTQTIKGRVVDKETQQVLPGASIILLDFTPLLGCVTNEDGSFKLQNVPVGRRTLEIRFLGYKPQIISELLVSSGKEIILNIEMIEQVTNLEQVVVKGNKNNGQSLNSMTTVSARLFNVEETQRYAGGFDDPARLATSFAGVASNEIESNGITVRGNSPTGVQWRIEGVEVHNPNHFAGAKLLGGGFVSFFSNQLLANSDFLTGAFPAEFGNALSAVFDMKLRTGNTDKREYTFQAGLMGLDFAVEGPFTKGKQSSYLVNYRYSTYGLLQNFLPEGEGLPIYQDLCFKLNFQTKAGVISFWGAGGIDDFYAKAETDTAEWKMISKRMDRRAKFNTGISGISHKYILKNNSYLNSSLAYSYQEKINTVQWMHDDFNLYEHSKTNNTDQNLVFSSYLNKKFSPAHTNRTGIVIKQLYYDYDMQVAPGRTLPLNTITTRSGSTQLLRFYSQSKFYLNNKLSANVGLNFQYFVFNGSKSIEPRAGIRWDATKRISFGLAYGNHSQLQELGYYMFEDIENEISNKDLGFTKAHHLIFCFDYQINENLRIKVEPYYQYLYNVPVVDGNSFSILNAEKYSDISEALVNKGTGTNMGIDLTFERSLQDGYYYMITASLFDSKYIGGDNIERNTLFNKNYVANVLGGKEWNLGKNGKKNLLGINGRLYFYGGNRQSPVDEETSLSTRDIAYDESRLFEDKEPSTFRVDLSFTLRKNKLNYSTMFEFQLINAFFTVISTHQDIDFVENKVILKKERTIMPSISWKIEF